MSGPSLSGSQVRKAGRVLRDAFDPARPDISPDALRPAIEILEAFRASHAYALTKASMGLRSVVHTEGCQRTQVSQRLKRAPTIINKLVRFPQMDLARMQDIGGCRAVLADIEVQLRTPAMHEWAIAVERFGGRIGKDLKSGQGPRPVLDWLRLVGVAMGHEEAGEAVPVDLAAAIEDARAAALPFLRSDDER